MSELYAVIGGSGLYALDGLHIESTERVDTPYGLISADLQLGRWHEQPVAFLPRHGINHQIPPHKINYRANIWALRNAGVGHIIAANAVGGISPQYGPQVLVLPDQIIDYTASREHSFFDGANDEVRHVDFTHPYSHVLREEIYQAALVQKIDLVDGGCYGCTNGPRFESAAEIGKMKADGCDLIGMTAMPEAALARELDIEYASIALVVNWCAGIDDVEISMDQIKAILDSGCQRIQRLISATLKASTI